MMKVTTLIPTRRNDGSEVSRDELNGIVGLFYAAFGACTLDGTTQGYWVNDGTLYQDECMKLFVACEESQLATAEQIVRDIGRQLGQLAMYLEVDRSSEVRILRID
jgi:hypothetical protein